jgi:hypothetical protein
MVMTRQPWDDVFDRVLVYKSPEYVYLFRPTAADLDATEAALGCRLPASYRAFTERFGLGEVAGWASLESLTDPVIRGQTRTEWWRADLVEHPSSVDELGRDFCERLIAFGSDVGGNTFAFHPGEVTNKRLAEYNVYELDRLGHWKKLWASSFAGFIERLGEMARRWAEENGDEPPPEGVIHFGPGFLRRRPFSNKVVKSWLAANSNAARNLAQAIREENRPDLFPVLADALEDAGCDSEHVLRACRDGNVQADGEWVLAVLLGKTKGM